MYNTQYISMLTCNTEYTETQRRITQKHKHTQWAWEEDLTCITHNTEKEKNGLNFSKRHKQLKKFMYYYPVMKS